MIHQFNPSHFEVYPSESGDIAIRDVHNGECVLIGTEQSELLVKFIRLVAAEIEDMMDAPNAPECNDE
jgi:hypothetical protein